MKNLIVQNPFEKPLIPKRTTWSYSSLKLFRKCHRKFYWHNILRLSSKREASPLVISNAMHEGLAKWYLFGKSNIRKIANQIAAKTKERIEKNVNFYDQDDYDELQVLLNTLTGMLVAYATVFKSDRANWKLTKQDVETWFSVNLGPFDFKGRIDLLPLQKRKQLLVDHKVVSNIQESYLEKLPLDSQLRSYILGATRDLKRSPKKVVYNLIRKCKLRQKSQESTQEFCDRIQQDYIDRRDFYFHREIMMFSKDDIEAFEYDLRKTHAEFAWLVNSSKSPLDPREWPCSDHICDEYFRTCEYCPLCLQGLDKGTARLYTQYNKEDKYED